MGGFMQTPEQMLHIMIDLVSVKSVTLTEAEKQFPLKVQEYVRKIPFFHDHPAYTVIHPTSDGRAFFTAMYKHEEAVKTVVLISHFDVVGVEDYGDLQQLAFDPIALTKELHSRLNELPEDARRDLETGQWLFGRGTMDMKCGLVQHLSLLEKASIEGWKLNIVLLTVPDEEVNSLGMREAVPELLKMAEDHGLNFSLFLNAEPIFTMMPGDEKSYYYTGSIGKIMPGALCFGKETHVGEPLSGMNAAWMSSVLSQEMEWNETFCETVNGQMSPPPTLLWQSDLKKEYSAQIPHRSVNLYNLFLMNKNPADVLSEMKSVAKSAAEKMEAFINEKFRLFGMANKSAGIRIITYEQLKEYAVNKTGKAHIRTLEEEAANHTDGDSRDKAIEMVDQLSIHCQELAPMIVLFYAPPYYPAVNTEENPLIKELSQSIIDYSKNHFGLEMAPVSYFNGISDLSYIGLKDSLSEMMKYHSNLPGGSNFYSIPFAEMEQLQAPVLNVGPIGRDAHKKTERLYLPYAFDQLPKLLQHLLTTHEKQ